MFRSSDFSLPVVQLTRVVGGFEVVKEISDVRLLAGHPVQDVTIRKVAITRVGSAADRVHQR